jgi:flagellar biosynthesis protein FlhG
MATVNNKSHRTKTISITSGKGGVGKTTMVCNLAYALARQGKKVLIFDGDLGMANVDIMFGVKSDFSIMDVLKGTKTMNEILVPLAPNIALIPGGTGLVELSRLNAFERRSMLDAVGSLDYQYDYLLIDTAPGLAENVLYLNSAAQVSSVVITPDPSSLADSYALIKVLNREYKETKFSIICNQVRDEIEGLALFNRFNEVVNRFLYIGLDYWGSVPQDQLLRKSTQNQRLILKHEPQSEAAKNLLKLSNKLETAMGENQDKSGLQFFWEQVVGVA